MARITSQNVVWFFVLTDLLPVPRLVFQMILALLHQLIKRIRVIFCKLAEKIRDSFYLSLLHTRPLSGSGFSDPFAQQIIVCITEFDHLYFGNGSAPFDIHALGVFLDDV